MSKDKLAYVYKVTSKGGKYYIGSTKNIDVRVDKHIRDLLNRDHNNYNLQECFDKNDPLPLDIVARLPRDQAYELEDKLIKEAHGTGMAMSIGTSAIGGDNLTQHRDNIEIRFRIRTSIKNNYDGMSEEERKRKHGLPGDRNGMYGKRHTQEVRDNSARRSRGNSYAKGNKWSEEARQRLSKIASKRTGDKNSFYGRKHTEEYKRNASIHRMGKPLNHSSCKKVSIDGKVYRTQTEAAKDLGVSPATITYRLKSKNKKYSSYKTLTADDD